MSVSVSSIATVGNTTACSHFRYIVGAAAASIAPLPRLLTGADDNGALGPEDDEDDDAAECVGFLLSLARAGFRQFPAAGRLPPTSYDDLVRELDAWLVVGCRD